MSLGISLVTFPLIRSRGPLRHVLHILATARPPTPPAAAREATRITSRARTAIAASPTGAPDGEALSALECERDEMDSRSLLLPTQTIEEGAYLGKRVTGVKRLLHCVLCSGILAVEGVSAGAAYEPGAASGP